jgi:hypothetical protein
MKLNELEWHEDHPALASLEKALWPKCLERFVEPVYSRSSMAALVEGWKQEGQYP